MTEPNKSLGQHWLHDHVSLQAMCDAGGISEDDVVLEIGPGLGTLTAKLVKLAKKVVAVEFDEALAKDLKNRVPADNLQIISVDFLRFDLKMLPKDYIVVANLPYYITSKIVRKLLESPNPPKKVAVLVQKEVAERMAAKPGQLSILGVAVQFYAEPKLGKIVSAELFTPPPKVDSQIISLTRRNQSLFANIDVKEYFRVVKAGFGEKRKKLRSSLSGGLHLSKQDVDHLLQKAGISVDARAQELTLKEWYKLMLNLKHE